MNSETKLSPSTQAHFRLLNGLNACSIQADHLYQRCKLAQDQIRLLDGAPRHDAVLDAEMLNTVTKFPYDALREHLACVNKDLATSAHTIRYAGSRIHGYFTGELKVKAEDRLKRHLVEAEELLAIFGQLKSDYEAPNKPYQIRKQTLSGLLPLFPAVLDPLRDLRKAIKSEPFDQPRYSVLLQLEATMIKLRAQVARWRDNPSQKMAGQIEVWFTQVKAFHDAINELQAVSMLECLRGGVQWGYRSGPWGSFRRVMPERLAGLAIEYPERKEFLLSTRDKVVQDREVNPHLY